MYSAFVSFVPKDPQDLKNADEVMDFKRKSSTTVQIFVTEQDVVDNPMTTMPDDGEIEMEDVSSVVKASSSLPSND